jgi:altronate dehydratase small subunit
LTNTLDKIESTATDARLLLLDPRDNVLVATVRVRAGEAIVLEGCRVVMTTDIPLGHKLARRSILLGEKILKYGAPVGSATATIGSGEHVHVHNVKSDYTPTYHLENARSPRRQP